MAETARALQATYLKGFPSGSSEATPYRKKIAKGEKLTLSHHLTTEVDSHEYVVLDGPASKRDGWWLYSNHWRFQGTEEGNNPVESAPNNLAEPAEDEPVPELTFKVPGVTAERKASDPAYWNGSTPSNFTWGEITKGGQRIPVSQKITTHCIYTAKRMDEIREYLGNFPIHVTSWYRDPRTNRAVGGASRSQHLSGLAVDFYVSGMNVVDVFYKLKAWRNAPIGLAVGNGFVHVDWRYGGRARWTYPGGPRVALW